MKQDLNILWAECQQILRDNLSQSAYQTWFAPVLALQYENDVLVLQVKSQFVVEYIEENYLDLLSRVLRKVFGPQVQLEYRITYAGSTIDLPSEPLKESAVRHKRELAMAAQDSANAWDSQLNTQYTFDNFIKGEPNKLARAAAIEIAKNPGKTIFNPLFLFGGSGVGKTHLAYAIGNEVCRLNPDARVLYVAANTFKLQFQDAVNRNQVPDFLMFYQSVDVLIVDDIQYFSDLKGTQDTFFQIFNYLQQSHKQLILTSDRSPMELRGIQDRLLSRFKWGLAAEITRPDYPLRKDILLYHVKKDGIKLDASIIEYVASNVTENVRDLEGVLASLLAYSTLTDSAIDMSLAEKVVSRLVELHPRSYPPADIITTVCQMMNLPERVITAKTRTKEAVRARNMVIYFIKKFTDSSLGDIGKHVHRDHATVAHSLTSMENQLSYDAVLRQEVAAIERQLGR
ncbi:MAG: chromosomal replication initiator protein DnaA [Paludibacteraceae bacterium]|nr:chromosomal replication initiator protein DnaA [Paludibacteraceae bacterium]